MARGNQMLNGGQVIVDYLIREKRALCVRPVRPRQYRVYRRALRTRGRDQDDLVRGTRRSRALWPTSITASAASRPRPSPAAGPARPICRSRSPTPISIRCRFSPSPATSRRAVRPRRVPGALPPIPGRFPSTVRPMCKRVFQPTRGEQMPLMVRQAWKTMVTGRPGPVVLDVPFDIFKEDAATEAPDPREWSANISSRCGADPEGVAKAAEMLIAAERPAILVGQGVRYGGAAAELLRLAERLNIPVGASASGLGAIDTHHPLSLGLVSRGGLYQANAAMRRVGCAAGARRAVRRPHLVVVDPGLFVHDPADQAYPYRYRPRRDRPQLSGGARADGRCAHLPAPALGRDRRTESAADDPGAAGLARQDRRLAQGMGRGDGGRLYRRRDADQPAARRARDRQGAARGRDPRQRYRRPPQLALAVLQAEAARPR